MIAIAYYLLKVMICSGALFLYYYLALRNRLFHHWNRFYLLAAIVVSLTVPLLKFTVDSEDSPALIISPAQAADNYVLQIQHNSSFSISTEQWISIAYVIISLFLFVGLIRSLKRITSIIRENEVHLIDDIKFVDTDVKGTPFSFFRYIFWNKEIDIQSQTGRRIFQHELVHVKEKHTLDKLFLQLIIILFWYNPFFWLIRREMQLIHEFIADKKAVEQHGTAAFAAMILQSAYPKQFSHITNQFFQSSIKRRLAMLTKIQNPKWNYVSRILVLPIVAILLLAFCFKTKEATSLAIGSGEQNTAFADSKVFAPSSGSDTLPAKISEINVNSKTQKVTIVYSNGKKEVLSLSEAVKRKLVNYDATGKEVKSVVIQSDNEPLYVIDKEILRKEDVPSLDPNLILKINVLKGEAAIALYGERGKNGVIEITTKKGASQSEADSVAMTADKKVMVDDKTPVFSKAEVPASVNPAEWRRFLETNLQPIIEQAAAKGMLPGQYTVNMRFIVNTDGSLTDFQALNDPGYGLAAAVKELLLRSPKWNPALQNGKKVRSYHTQPITFVIAEEKDDDKKTKKIDSDTSL